MRATQYNDLFRRLISLCWGLKSDAMRTQRDRPNKLVPFPTALRLVSRWASNGMQTPLDRPNWMPIAINDNEFTRLRQRAWGHFKPHEVNLTIPDLLMRRIVKYYPSSPQTKWLWSSEIAEELYMKTELTSYFKSPFAFCLAFTWIWNQQLWLQIEGFNIATTQDSSLHLKPICIL